MDTNIIINGVVIQSEWVEAIERRMREGLFMKVQLYCVAIAFGCPERDNVPSVLASRCVTSWSKLGKIREITTGLWRMATPAETKAHNLKIKGGVA